jgi:hypothetical protein
MSTSFTARRWLNTAAFFAAGCVVTACLIGGAAHAITDSVFRYATPQRGFLQLDPAGFIPMTNEGPGSYRIFYVYNAFIQTAVDGACFSKSVELPDGAKISAVNVWFETRARVSLYRHEPAAGGSTVMADETFHSAQTRVRPGTMSVSNPALRTVDTRNYSYALIVCLPHTDDYFFGARVNYTYANAGD